MRIIWKRYTVGAFLLAFLSLLISGCGDYGANPTVKQAAPVTKTVSGFVSNSTTGLPLAGATVTAYAIDASGAPSSTPLPGSGFDISDVDGSYSLKIPADYVGSLLMEATIPQGLSKPAKTVLLGGGRVIRSLVPATTVSLPALPPVMISFATETVVVFLEQNVTPTSAASGFTSTGFSSDNIRKADIVLETFFGPSFYQVPPPQSDVDIATSSPAQQNLLVSIQALNTVIASGSPGTSLTQIVIALSTTGLSGVAGTITDAISSVSDTLVDLLPPGFQPSPALITAITTASDTPVVGPSLTDTTPPTAPTGLAASAVNANKVNLTWNAATDTGTGVAGYTVYRSIPLAGSDTFAALATLGPDALSYSDTTTAASTLYHYEVVAFDGGRNTSAFSTLAAVTTPAASTTPTTTNVFTITGKVTSNGVPLSGVLLSINGAGTGSALSGSDGSYSFEVLDGSYLITPTLPGYDFSPITLLVTVSDANLTGQDFNAFLNGAAVGTVTLPSGSVNGSVKYPDGSVTSAVTYPSGTVIGGVSYPPGTVVVSVTFSNGTVIGGVSYPAGTVFSTITLPSGTVVGGVSYPAGTVVSIVSFPGGTAIGGVSYPGGTVISRVSIPNGAVATIVSYPNGTVSTSVSYPTGTLVVTVTYPDGTVSVSVTYASATVVGGVSYPAGTVVSTVTYPNGVAIGGVSFPSGTVLSTVTYPNGTVSSSLTYNNIVHPYPYV